MDGVSAVFAVVSLGVQLVGTIREVIEFLRSVHNAPDEITRLVQVLDQLRGTLEHVKDLVQQQSLILGLPGSFVSIASALRNCEKRIIKLEKLVNQLKRYVDRNYSFQKAWATLKTVFKKEEIVELRGQLYEDMMALQLSISINSTHLQLHQIQATSALSASSRMILENQSLERIRNDASKRDTNTSSRETSSLAYRGLFGNVRVQRNSRFLARFPRSRAISKKAIAEEIKIVVAPSFLSKAFEMRYINSLSRISRTLNVYPTMKAYSRPFMMCREGDLQGLQIAFSNRSISPFVVDQYGLTLLHYAGSTSQTELCSLLLQLGVDPDQTTDRGSKALHQPGLPGNGPKLMAKSTEQIVDTLRILAKAQDDVSTSDVSDFFSSYIGPPEGADLMLSLDAARYEILQTDQDTESFPALATGLRAYGEGLTTWKDFIRRLLRNGVDVHGIVPRRHCDENLITMFTSHYPCRISEPPTPLDELFTWTETPFEGSQAANDWLQMLSSEGYDILAYLKEEMALHTRQQQLTYPSTVNAGYDIPRKLILELGHTPSISWDWWIDPRSPAFLVRQELKYMDIFVRDWALYKEPWEDDWPFTYPEWSDAKAPDERESTYEDWDQSNKRAGRRAERRLREKAVKVARSQGNYERSRMPGAWVA